MKLEDVSLLSETFYEDEEKALNDLPRNAIGLEELLNYVECNDGSYLAWEVLLDDFSFLMTDEMLTRLKQKAKALWN